MLGLSSPIDSLRDEYDVLIVGSGYGGSIAAARIAQAYWRKPDGSRGRKLSVCLLERGEERWPGEYPDTMLEAAGELLNPVGLYDVRWQQDMSVLVGCGLGGTSLINANVALRPDPRVFQQPEWPNGFQQDVAIGLDQAFARAEQVINPQPVPFPRLSKLVALRRAARPPDEPFITPPLAVCFDEPAAKRRRNGRGRAASAGNGMATGGPLGDRETRVERHACTKCGDCVTGCNHWSKSTTLMHYLAEARRRQVEIFTRTVVRHIDPVWADQQHHQVQRWDVHLDHIEPGHDIKSGEPRCVRAGVVVLAAGTLGSTEILLRSRSATVAAGRWSDPPVGQLPMSDRIGTRFSGNGDVLAFAYNTKHVVNGVGSGTRWMRDRHRPGPCIAGTIDARCTPALTDGVIVQEGVIPAAIAPLMPLGLATAAAFTGIERIGSLREELRESLATLESILFGARRGALRNTLTFLAMGHDDGGGELNLRDDALQIDWPGVGGQPVFTAIDRRLRHASVDQLGGEYVANPEWSPAMGQRLITVHPLGGCPMAERADEGVVNHKGQLFRSPSGNDVYDSLYVCDGAVIPRPLGVNPLLTISAIAERTIDLLIADRKSQWVIDDVLPPAEPDFQLPSRRTMGPGLRFRERMHGHWRQGPPAVLPGHPTTSYRGGEHDLTLLLDVTIGQLRAFIKNPKHPARISGRVHARDVSTRPLVIGGGSLALLAPDSRRAEGRTMTYRLPLRAEDGRTFLLVGEKYIRTASILRLWRDTTTLHVTLYEGKNEHGPVLRRGIVRLSLSGFARQLLSMRVLRRTTQRQRLTVRARFGLWFGATLAPSYGGVLRPRELAWRTTPLDPPRTYPCVGPTIHPVRAADGTLLRLTRYHWGGRGPVILAPSFAATARCFATPTIDVNLVEFLGKREYDVWTFDYRSSPDLEACLTDYTLDDIAHHDWPAALDAVRSITGAASVQVVAHCVGALTFQMAMMAGLEGVRSAVCSQLTAMPRFGVMLTLKTWLRASSILRRLGVATMTQDFDETRWTHRLLDTLLRLYPTREQCRSPVCRRGQMLYGDIVKHDQLNEATHAHLRETFNRVSLSPFDHLARMVRKGRAVDREGRDTYLPNAWRLALPIAFLHGEENHFVRPASSQLMYEHLCSVNDPGLYSLHLIPGYGHTDCFMGANAATDVFPLIAQELAVQQARCERSAGS